MAIDYDLFLDELVAYQADACSPPLKYATTPRQIVRWTGVDDGSLAAVHSIVRIYNGAVPFVPVASVSIQSLTRGASRAAAWAQATKLYGTLCDASGRALRMVNLNNFRINGVDLRPAMEIAVDELKRVQVVFNFDVRLVAKAS